MRDDCPFSRHCVMVSSTEEHTGCCRNVAPEARPNFVRPGPPERTHSIDMETYFPVAVSGAKIGRRKIECSPEGPKDVRQHCRRSPRATIGRACPFGSICPSAERKHALGPGNLGPGNP